MAKPKVFSLAAAILSACGLGVHLTLGGRDVVEPLFRLQGLDPVVRDTLYLCWHFVTVSIAVMSGCFMWGGLTLAKALIVVATFLAVGFTVSGVALGVLIGADPVQAPQGWLFLPVTILGLFAIRSR